VVSKPGAATEADVLASFGYEQKLERAMGSFSSYAVSFSGMSISAAIFLTIGFVTTQAGSAGIWSWPISSVAVQLDGLVFDHLVGRIPVAGYAYQWSSRLANPRLGWFVAVAGLIGFAVGCAGTIYGVTPYFLSEFGITATRNANIFGAIVLTLVVATINIMGIRLASRLNNMAVVTEIVGGVGIAVAILIYAIVKHPHNVSYLFQQQPGAQGGYAGAFVLAFLLGAFTYAAWELPADLAEDTKDAPNVAAMTMVVSIASVGYNLVYLFVAAIFVYKVRRGTLPPSFGKFSLGRWAQPVGWAAVVWQLFLVGTLTLPNINQSVGWTTLAMIAVGGVWYLAHVRPALQRGDAGPARPDMTA
jgi:amino acid transporter